MLQNRQLHLKFCFGVGQEQNDANREKMVAYLIICVPSFGSKMKNCALNLTYWLSHIVFGPFCWNYEAYEALSLSNWDARNRVVTNSLAIANLIGIVAKSTFEWLTSTIVTRLRVAWTLWSSCDVDSARISNAHLNANYNWKVLEPSKNRVLLFSVLVSLIRAITLSCWIHAIWHHWLSWRLFVNKKKWNRHR